MTLVRYGRYFGAAAERHRALDIARRGQAPMTQTSHRQQEITALYNLQRQHRMLGERQDADDLQDRINELTNELEAQQ